MFTNLVDRFRRYLIDYSEGEVSGNTISAYLADIKYFLIHIKGKDLSIVSARDIIEFVGLPIFKKPFYRCSVKTRRRRLSSVRSFFNFLVNEGDVISSPVPVRLVRARRQKYIPPFLKPFEVQRIINLCKDTLLETIIIVLFGTGMRLEEMRTCQLNSVDIDKREMKVLGKGGKERYVPFSTELAKTLKKYLKWREFRAQPGVTELFVSERGIQLTKNQIEYLFRKLSKLSGIVARPHKLRHSFATDAISRGMNPKSLQRILGHESQVTTDWYTHIEPNVRSDYDKAFG